MAVIELAIGPGGMPGRFRVEVIDSPAGHLSALAGLDVESLAARRGLLQQEVLASSVRARGVPETEQFLREAGQALFAGLLGAGGVAGCYRASAAVAAERGEELRVVLRIDDPALAGLPWEAMFDAELGTYVCRRDQLVRHVPVASAPVPLQVRAPLRILGVASSPRGLPRLDAGKEKDHLARALARPASQGLAEVHWAPDATWAGLQDMLMDGEWHVLHYIGHGDFDPGRDEGMLALEREDGFADMVSARRLVDLLRQARPMPRLVVLNSCAGAATGAGDLFSGTAAALVRGGVSAVAAMQYKISDGAAIAFARGFYAAIARGRGVDDAVSSGRVAILGTSDHTLEWVTPVLYLRGNQARLFAPAPAMTTRGAASPDPWPAPDRARATRNLNDAMLAAHAITDKGTQAWALARVAGALAATDPVRAARLRAEAERTAQAITREINTETLLALSEKAAATDPNRGAQAVLRKTWRVQALADIAVALAATDPDRAERTAQAIADDSIGSSAKARALADIAGALAATDPYRAARLSTDAERTAHAMIDDSDKPRVLADIAGALAATDPVRAARLSTDAERAALAITDTGDFRKARALAGVAQALAATDPYRAARLSTDAERAAHAITGDVLNFKETVLADIAGVLAATDPDHAERIAHAITDDFHKAKALAGIAGALAATDPDRAERIAHAITHDFTRAKALAGIAGALAATDPDRAERIAHAITHDSEKVRALVKIAEAWNQG